MVATVACGTFELSMCAVRSRGRQGGGGIVRTLLRALVGVLVAVSTAAASPALAGPLPVFAGRLPSRPFPCPLSGSESRPDDAYRSLPGVLLFLDATATEPDDLERLLGKLQQEFAPWFRWGAVVTGRPAPDEEALRRFRTGGALRVDNVWSDPDGAWRESFGLAGLPAAVLVNESGHVTTRQVGLRAEDEPRLLQAFERLVSASRLRGRPMRDFKLPESGSGRLTTFADLPLRDYTLLLSVRSGCQSCLDEMQTLRDLERRHPGRMALVTIAHDSPAEAADAAPDGSDLSLADPDLLYAERYSLVGLPALLVVDRRGTIVLARQGFLPDEAASLTEDLDLLLSGPAPPRDGGERFAEFLRIRAEALELLGAGRAGLAALFLERALELFPEFYTVQLPLAQAYLAAGRTREAARAYARYLAAEPRASDRGAVLAELKTLAGPD